MNSVDHLREIFHAIAGVLVWPVLAGLLGLVAAMLVAGGTFAREAWDRRRDRCFSLARDRAALDTAARLALAAQSLDDVRAAEAWWRDEQDITAVPAIIFNGKYAIMGGQPPATFVKVIRRIVAGEV